MQENLKHTLPSDIFELLQESTIDLRIGYQAQQLEWLSLQRSFEATFPPATEDRPATVSSLPVRYFIHKEVMPVMSFPVQN